MKQSNYTGIRSCTIYIICTLLAVFAILSLTACKDIVEENDEDVTGEIDNSIFDAYIYQYHNILSLQLPFSIGGVIADGENIVYWYADSTPEVVVTAITDDGQVRQRTHIPAQGWRVSVGGLQITNDDNIAIVLVEDHENGSAVVTYGVYDRQGAKITTIDISNAVARRNDFVQIKQVVFADDGNIAVVIDEAGPFNDVVLLSSDGIVLGQLQINSVLNICRLRDGRIVALQRERFVEGAGVSLREIDFTTGDWGNMIPLTIPGASRLLSAGAGQDFDLIVDDGRYLYGYTLEDHTQTPLLDWMEAGVIPTFDHHICALPDDRFILLQSELSISGEVEKWLTDFYVLSRASRDDLQQRIVITLGGYFIDEGIRREVIAFNRENQDYQIEIQQIAFSDLDRLRVEMITTGRGPDIFLDHPMFPVGSEFYADLYTFIDADPVIARSDFFSSVLNILEAKDGTLPVITQHFYLSTYLAMRDTAAQIGPLTFTNLLKRLNEPDAPFLHGNSPTREGYVFQLINSSGDTFIDLTNNKAYLDSEEFISVLEIAYNLPEYQGEAGGSLSVTEAAEVERVRNGEQLLFPMMLSDPGNFRIYRALFDDVIAVGMPTNEGGQHEIMMMWERFGISANSAHKDAAWDFVRRFFLPDTEVPPYGIPLRIDSYEKLIFELKIPNIIDGTEVPQRATWFGHEIEIYAMTDEEAAALREIIDTASLSWRQDATIDMIISEDIPPFLSGAKSATETARILQNRVQRYLDERR